MTWTTTHTPMGTGEPAVDCAKCGKLATEHAHTTDGAVRRYAPLCLACCQKASEPLPAAPPDEPAPAPAAPPAPEPKRIVFPIPEHHRIALCRSCTAAIVWIETNNGRRMPVEPYGPKRGESHFAHCPNAAAHRNNPR